MNFNIVKAYGIGIISFGLFGSIVSKDVAPLILTLLSGLPAIFCSEDFEEEEYDDHYYEDEW